jgi:hypothetical protein
MTTSKRDPKSTVGASTDGFFFLGGLRNFEGFIIRLSSEGEVSLAEGSRHVDALNATDVLSRG